MAGFSGLVGVFMNRSGRWAYVDQFRIVNLLLMSLTPGFMAFITLGLLPVSEHAVEFSAGLFFLIVAAQLFFIPRSRKKVPAEHQHIVGLQIFVPMSSCYVIIMTLQLLVALSVIDAYEFTIYYYCLILSFLMAAFQFARLILVRPDAES